jgi:hypothetical protein
MSGLALGAWHGSLTLTHRAEESKQRWNTGEWQYTLDPTRKLGNAATPMCGAENGVCITKESHARFRIPPDMCDIYVMWLRGCGCVWLCARVSMYYDGGASARQKERQFTNAQHT